MVREYVSNSGAVLDSLLRYQLLKQQMQPLERQLTDCRAEVLHVRTDANVLAEKYVRADNRLQDEQKKRKLARLENWIWRLGIVAIGYWTATR